MLAKDLDKSMRVRDYMGWPTVQLYIRLFRFTSLMAQKHSITWSYMALWKVTRISLHVLTEECIYAVLT